jgi:hypothetical protein
MNRTTVSGHHRTSTSGPEIGSPDIRTDNGPPFRGPCPVSGPEEFEYEVLWSGSLERLGLCPQLNGWATQAGYEDDHSPYTEPVRTFDLPDAGSNTGIDPGIQDRTGHRFLYSYLVTTPAFTQRDLMTRTSSPKPRTARRQRRQARSAASTADSQAHLLGNQGAALSATKQACSEHFSRTVPVSVPEGNRS